MTVFFRIVPPPLAPFFAFAIKNHLSFQKWLQKTKDRCYNNAVPGRYYRACPGHSSEAVQGLPLLGGFFMLKSVSADGFGHNRRKSGLALCVEVWYGVFGAAIDGGRLALDKGATSCPLIFGKGGCPMVTYSELFAYSLVIIGLCGLFIQVYKKK
ncbi:hypothetical protein AALC17_15040 [Oscillospiraceae bacterium 38-13]